MRSHREWSATLLFFVLGAILAAIVIRGWKLAFFYPAFMPSAIMWACGYGAVEVIDRPPELTAFTLLQSPSFDCDALKTVRGTTGLGLFASAHLYLGVIAALLWRWLGVAHVSLWPLVSLLYGAYAAGCFRLVRLYAPFWLAVATGVIVALSPVALSVSWSVRDFSKAPFIIWTVVLFLLAIRAGTFRSVAALSAGVGIVLGVGTGFRPDVLICLPLGLFVFLVGLDRKAFVFPQRLVVAALFLAAWGLAAAPIIARGGAPSVGFFATQGATEPFRKALGLGAAPYDLGDKYSDELALTAITADLRPRDPAAWDAGEGEPFQSISQAMRRSGQYALGWALQFPADVTVRALKAAYVIAGYYVILAPERRALDPAAIVYPLPTSLTLRLAPVYNALAQPWLPILGALGLLAFVFRACRRSPREGVCLTVILAAFLTYPSLQFSVRHFFHLEVLLWLGMLSLVLLPFEAPAPPSRLRGFLVTLGALVMALGLAYSLALLYQHRYLQDAIERLLAAPREQVDYQVRETEGGFALVSIPIPERHAALVYGAADSLTKTRVTIAVPWEVRAAADRLLFAIGGPDCGPEPIEITLRYQKTEAVWQPFDRTLVVTPRTGAATLLVAPAFYRPTQAFAGITLPAARLSCLRSIERVLCPRELPALFTAVLPADWRQMVFALRPLARWGVSREAPGE